MSDKTRAEELVWKKKFPNEEFDLDNYYDWARENSKEAYNLLYEVSQSEIDTIINSVKIYVEVIDDQKREIDELTKEVERLRKEREWISVEDRLPIIGKGFKHFSDDVLCLFSDNTCSVTFYDYELKKWNLRPYSPEVTCWQRLPPINQ